MPAVVVAPDGLFLEVWKKMDIGTLNVLHKKTRNEFRQ